MFGKNKKIKRGVYFTLDALFGALLIVSAITVFSDSYIIEDKIPDLSYLSYDLIKSFSGIKTIELNNTYLKELISNGTINNTNNSLLETIGELWVLNKTNEAQLLAQNISAQLIPSRYGFSISVNFEEVFSNLKPITKSLISSKRLISGIEKFKPISGSSAKVFLQGIKEKTMKDYIYFGGFVGQGNVSHFIESIPSDANITGLYMEYDMGHDFSIKINNQSCPSDGYIFNVNTPIMYADSYILDNCTDIIIPGVQNNFSINYDTNLMNETFVGGGFIRITYKTSQMYSNINDGYYRYYFPGIEGLINLYTSFYIPGNITNIEIFLHYFFNHSDTFNKTFYLKIGNVTVYEDKNSTEEVSAYGSSFGLDDSTLRTLLQYENLSSSTVPIRLGAHNLTGKDRFIGNADIALITDYSGSMKSRAYDWSGNGNNGGSCDDLEGDNRRTKYAKCADQDFVTYMLENFTQNRMWPIWLQNNGIGSYETNPSDYLSVYANVVPTGNGRDQTCLSCSLNKAYDIFTANNDPTKKKFVVMMTDGCPTHCPDDGCNGTGTGYGLEICDGICDDGGNCDSSEITTMCNDCTSDQRAILSTKFSAQRLVDDYDVTIYTVGFGPLGDCSASGELLKDIAIIGNGTFQNTTNVSKLYEIYQNISEEIILLINQTSQTVYIEGTLEETILFGDSYIDVNYTPLTSPPIVGEIEVPIEKDLPNCTSIIDIPAEVRIVDAKVASYSAHHWTDLVDVNNNTVFYLGDYLSNYVPLGDPFVVQVPNTFLTSGQSHNITTRTGDTIINSFNCSVNNTLILKGLIKSVVTYSDVLEIAVGCVWEIEFEDGGLINVSVPNSYNGTNTCSYTNLSKSYNGNDTYDDAMLTLLDQLDFDDDGRIFVNLDENDFIVDAISIQKVPYPWGPAIAEVQIWQ